MADPPTSKDLKKRRGPKEPNPLSMKKKKVNEASLHAKSSKVANKPSDAKVSTGSKRKAEESSAEDYVIQQTSNSNLKTRRRKRRKNHTSEDATHLAS